MTKPDSAARSIFSSIVGIAVLFALLSNAWGESDDERIVKDLVDQFLITLGEGDLDALPAMFVSNANIGTASLRDGKWVASTKTFEDWFGELKAETTWTRFREPVTEFTVHIEDGQMAFVRADATYIVDDRVLSHNIDYFTLVRDGGTWRFLSASYVARPVSAD
jgi:ketosteroid isomerase-like protein